MHLLKTLKQYCKIENKDEIKCEVTIAEIKTCKKSLNKKRKTDNQQITIKAYIH